MGEENLKFKPELLNVIDDIVKQSLNLEERWEKCAFDTLASDIKHLEMRAKEEGINGMVCEFWIELAKKIFKCRVEELTGLPVVEGLLDD